MVDLLNVSLKPGTELETSLDARLPLIEGDDTQLHQVIMNLTTNAADAIGDQGGRIGITTRTARCDADFLDGLFLKDQLKPGKYVVLEITDTGCGMAEETMGRIFDPFFTTKRTGHGLGLAAVLGIVRAHHAGLMLESEPGTGSTFTLLFPVRGAAPASAASAADPLTNSLSGAVLLVEDEETVRHATRLILEHIGFDVIVASDGNEGVYAFQMAADNLQAVVLDIEMPGKNGAEVFGELRAIRPDIPILISSGHSQGGVVPELLSRGNAAFIHKPYKMAQLREQIARLVRPGPSPTAPAA
jgi:CheY-like chemotaxis protein